MRKILGQYPEIVCEECFSPLEVAFDYDALKKVVSKDALSRRSFNMWRYAANFFPCPKIFARPMPLRNTARRRAPSCEKLGVQNLYVKNDAVCFPSLSFKDRVVATALAAARRFEFKTVGCSSTGNLANAVARNPPTGFRRLRVHSADLEPAKILNTAVYARVSSESTATMTM